jgi:hypothetical protein
MSKIEVDTIDWSLTTWNGSLREQLRRWSELPLERIVLAQEEMQDLAQQFGPAAARQEAPKSRLER